MTSIQPPVPYSPTELATLYPSSLALHQVHIFLRHGERTPARKRFAHLGHPQFWPYCDHARQIRTIVSGPPPPGSADPSEVTLHWRRQLLALGADSSINNHEGPAGHDAASLCDTGGLTNAGRQTTHALGVHLRQLYVNSLGFLPPKLTDPSVVYLRSTEFPRALESLQHTFTGLYPPNNRSSTLPPFVIHTAPLSDETLFPNSHRCRRLDQITRAFSKVSGARWDNSPELAQVNMLLGPYLSADRTKPAATSIDPPKSSDVPAIVGLLDHINASRATGSTQAVRLPHEFYLPSVINTLEAAAVDEWYAFYNKSDEARKLGMGPLLSGILTDFITSVESPAPDIPKMKINGCHDTTIGSFLDSVGAGDGRWPPFTSHLAVELFKDAAHPGPTKPSAGWFGLGGSPNKGIGRRPLSELKASDLKKLDGYFVRLRYNDRVVKIPGCALPGNHLPGDDSFCTLAVFKKIVDKMTPVDWKTECNSNLDKPGVPDKAEPGGFY